MNIINFSMKRLILSLIILAFAVSAHADEPVLLLKDGYRIEQDRWEPDRKNIVNQNGKEVGHVKRDRWEKDKWNIYTNDSVKKKGTVQRDHWQPEKWNVDRNGKHVKTLKKADN